jgi:hypothetical protein
MKTFKSFIAEEKPKDYPGEGGKTFSPTGKTGTHRETGEKTYEYAEYDKEGKATGARHYKNIQGKHMGEEVELDEVAAWQRKEGKSESGGLNRKGIESYRRENPGSKLSMAVTTKPSKLKPGSKAANRRKSFCARMGGMKKRLTSAKTANDPDSRINKALRKWNC